MRLFYALMPSDDVIAALRETMWGVAGARWQSDAQLHLTLRFVGDVSDRIADDLVAGLRGSVSALPPLGLSGVGFFETRGNPNALWVRVVPREPLLQLHRRFDRACQHAGLEPEGRAYLPHITVARLPRTAGSIDSWIGHHAGLTVSPASFSRCSLVESLPGPDGSHYEELASVPLR